MLNESKLSWVMFKANAGLKLFLLLVLFGEFVRETLPTLVHNQKDCIFPMVAFYSLTISFTMLYYQSLFRSKLKLYINSLYIREMKYNHAAVKSWLAISYCNT